MIGMNTFLTLTDNSGVTRIKCIKFYKKTIKSKINIKDKFIGVLTKVKLNKQRISVKLKNIHRRDKKQGFLVRTKKKIYRCDRSSIKFFDNKAILIDKKNKPLATRIKGVIPREFREKKTIKIVLLARHLV